LAGLLAGGIGLVGCGIPPSGGPDSHMQALMSIGGPEATASVPISFQSPRTSFSSEKIDLRTGKTLSGDDGMGPEGDISFFYDGSRFHVIANAGGGANRTLAPAESGRAKGEFAMAPLPLAEGSEVLVKHGHGTSLLLITELRAGSMRFLPDGIGTGSGSVAFSYGISPN
jgi:hypothetical protein